jgi:hypothetical protein
VDIPQKGKAMSKTEAAVLRRLLCHYKPPCLLPRQKRELWTQPYMVRPALVKTTFGNGSRLLALSPVMHRPAYYLVWIDDRWSTNNHYSDTGEYLCEHLDDIWSVIEEEFGSRYCDDNGDPGPYRWPEEDSRDGCSWWEASIYDVLTRRQEQQFRRLAKGKKRASKLKGAKHG